MKCSKAFIVIEIILGWRKILEYNHISQVSNYTYRKVINEASKISSEGN